ncbi:hypothetical protein Fleli_2751 [Bernardetia litoralis DSM 6794]|uniref:Uncharacterized protein n=1 Tax=Bernardetia litoralis (strain ATCC 23117 / DSM 6794 / NBRC 15988 / NCIMB 1366 / Fx l1 / Sio-4) TaxID=880071 RepID=I4AMC0_BERLS|nr:hypothetical protein Fleli_2751 [Bernardetia litoralis DSM 6794]
MNFIEKILNKFISNLLHLFIFCFFREKGLLKIKISNTIYINLFKEKNNLSFYQIYILFSESI